jgi:DNA-binding CsgD family transcriptional regulator
VAQAGLRAPLLERERELARIEEGIAETAAGASSVLLIEGPPGVGKTRLVAEAHARIEAAGIELFTARATELERGLGFGVVRQLFELALAQTGEAEREDLFAGAAELARPVLEVVPRATGQPEDPFPRIHGLYWLVANLAARRPCAISVDDVHWADLSSLNWLRYLVHRAEGLALLVLLASRPAEAGAGSALLDALRAEPVARGLEPGPLSSKAVADLVRLRLGAAPEPPFSDACRGATGGNPFLLSELVLALAADGISPVASEVPRLHGFAPEAIAGAILLRLGRLPEKSRAVARALAILGAGANLRHAATLAGVEEDEVGAATEDLVRASLVTRHGPLDFVHPVVRAAVYADIPTSVKQHDHARAARLLAAARAPADSIATHVLAVEPSGDAWAAEQLRAAAADASARGSPEAAAGYLRRALAEPPPPGQGAALLLDLARTEAATHPAASFQHFEAAFDATTDSTLRGTIALDWARALQIIGRATDGAAVVARALDEPGDDPPPAELAAKLESHLVVLPLFDCAMSREAFRRLERHRASLSGASADFALLSAATIVAVWTEEPRERAIDLAHRTLALSTEAEPGLDTFTAVAYAAYALRCADELDTVQAVWNQLLEQARSAAVKSMVVTTCCFQCEIGWMRGELAEAVADGRTAWEGNIELGWDLGMPWVAGHLIEPLIDLGRLTEADELADQIAFEEENASRYQMNLMLCARGRLRLEQGRPREALADLLACGAVLEQGGMTNPGALPWRSRAALACVGLGERDRAAELAADEVERARRWGAARPHGVALRASGLVTGGSEGIESLSEACAVLENSPSRIEHARALGDLGAALRRAGHKADAQEPLRQALDLAVACGAAPLADRAREELHAAGARPRRDRVSGRHSLTASESRVTRLAVEGRTNREIAQALFVTPKTVETHLRHAYQKLNIASRAELEAALEAPA